MPYASARSDGEREREPEEGALLSRRKGTLVTKKGNFGNELGNFSNDRELLHLFQGTFVTTRALLSRNQVLL